MLLGGNFWIVAWFFLAALVYSSAGFGGGSTYTALLVLNDVDHRVLPMLSLVCNLLVVSGACLRFTRQKQMPWSRCVPLVVGSIPMAWVGGSIALDREVFVPLLSGTLIVAGVLLLWGGRKQQGDGSASSSLEHENDSLAIPPLSGSMDLGWRSGVVWQTTLGAGLGLLAGLVGIGGGIFLSPVLHLSRWSHARDIAATSSLFILVNSVAGLIGQTSKHGWSLGEIATEFHTHAPWWPWLFVSVLIGGQIGNRAASSWLSHLTLRRITAVIVLAAGIRLGWM
ncbi:sulfite exporter TauE/SafE family protein [Rhodopirellula sp. P2]|uniref:sulfite exporter TauE/SafE family protein n=1 Tax=Rhodopirellula sp. P2 TaxID=2127060 RepID=UPI0023681248|nr:sulfite exporter TauE/SafE family protein [Rhodopirellula sp. P2]WDQ17964.1 sulfite exporter TauE/SafE family protein [Rhodopirellula sp. P2]